MVRGITATVFYCALASFLGGEAGIIHHNASAEQPKVCSKVPGRIILVVVITVWDYILHVFGVVERSQDLWWQPRNCPNFLVSLSHPSDLSSTGYCKNAGILWYCSLLLLYGGVYIKDIPSS